jgi:hypothetical protein
MMGTFVVVAILVVVRFVVHTLPVVTFLMWMEYFITFVIHLRWHVVHVWYLYCCSEWWLLFLWYSFILMCHSVLVVFDIHSIYYLSLLLLFMHYTIVVDIVVYRYIIYNFLIWWHCYILSILPCHDDTMWCCCWCIVGIWPDVLWWLFLHSLYILLFHFDDNVAMHCVIIVQYIRILGILLFCWWYHCTSIHSVLHCWWCRTMSMTLLRCYDTIVVVVDDDDVVNVFDILISTWWWKLLICYILYIDCIIDEAFIHCDCCLLIDLNSLTFYCCWLIHSLLFCCIEYSDCCWCWWLLWYD